MELPPGQRAVSGFPRFGVDLDHPPPTPPENLTIEVTGELTRRVSVRPDELLHLPRREVVAGLHCVAGWSAVGLTWAGVTFADLYGLRIEPALAAGARVAYVVFVGLDGFRSIVTLEDALQPNVLVADRLEGRPLTADHGAPVRLVSPDQYGFVSTKHLCRIELYPSEPVGFYHPNRGIQRALRTVRPHRRARAAYEERHRYVPSLLLRPLYRSLVKLPAPPLPLPGATSGPKLPDSAHTDRPWRIHTVAPDFQLLDVWSLPTPGGPGDFPRLVHQFARDDPSENPSRPIRALFAIRDQAGAVLGWDDPGEGVGTRVPSLRDRLPADLLEGERGPDFDSLPFTSVYLTEVEWAAELANRTVHGVLHLSWVSDPTGGYRGQMAVLVKPNGLLGRAYLAGISWFRNWVVFPSLMRDIGRGWDSDRGRALSGDNVA